LQGATASDLPAEHPTKVGFFTILKTATMEGVTILPHLLTLASEVIESSGANTVTGGCYDSLQWHLAGRHVEWARESPFSYVLFII